MCVFFYGTFDGRMNAFVIGINLQENAVINCTSLTAFLRVFVFACGRMKGGVNKDRETWRMDSGVM